MLVDAVFKPFRTESYSHDTMAKPCHRSHTSHGRRHETPQLIRKSTIDAYTYHVGKFAEFLGKSPLEATAEDVRSFQLHMIEVRKIGMEFLQPGGLWATVPRSNHIPETVACRDDSLR